MHSVYAFAILLVSSAGTVAANEIQDNSVTESDATKHDAPGFVVGVIEEGSPEWADVQYKLPDVLPKPEVLVRSRFVRIDANWMTRSDVPEQIYIEFFDDFACLATRKHVRDGIENNWTWRGACDPHGSQLVRIIKSPMGFVTVTLELPATKYGIKWLRDSTHVVWETDLTKLKFLTRSEE